MSTPCCAITRTASGRTASAGAEPALSTAKRPPPWRRRKPAAICERALLWVHRNSTRIGSLILSLARGGVGLPGRRCAAREQPLVEAGAERPADERAGDVGPEAPGWPRDGDRAPA